MLLVHIYGLVMLLTILAGGVTVALAGISYYRSRERFLGPFLGFLMVFNSKILLILIQSYLILNLPVFLKVLFPLLFYGGILIDCAWGFLFLLVIARLLAGKNEKRFAAFGGILFTVSGLLLVFGGNLDTVQFTYEPGGMAVVGKVLGLIGYATPLVAGLRGWGRLKDEGTRFFIAASLITCGIGCLEILAGFAAAITAYPYTLIKLPNPEEIGFPWLSLYFGLYLAAVCFYCLRYQIFRQGRGQQKPVFSSESAFETYGISAREREILLMVVEGLSNGEIAQKLFISTGTVKSHMQNIFGKTGLRSRTKLVHLFMKGPSST